MGKVCFISGTGYDQPLDPTSEKKFRALTAIGDFFVIGFSRNVIPRRFTEHASFYLLPRIPVAILRYAETFLLGMPLAIWLIFRHGVQILIAQSPYEGFAAAHAKKIAGCFGYKVNLVVESHGDFEESLFMQRRILFPNLYRLLMRYTARFALKHADCLRAVSNSTRRQLERWEPGKAIVQFATWTDIDAFLEVDGKKVGQSSKTILYAGVLIPRKGVHHLLAVFARIARDFPQACLVITGREENKSYAAKLRSQIEEVGFNGRVQLIGEVSQRELARRMQEACVFVLPTYSEGLPRVVFEAMAAGLPVIASAVSGIPDIVQDGVSGFLVPPGDEAALAEKIRWVFEHPQETLMVGRHARIFAEGFFSAKSYINGYQRMFDGVQVI